MSLTVKIFADENGDPSGVPATQTIRNVYEKDAEFFNKYNIKISMEPLSLGGHAVYADTGKVTDGEPDELIEISGTRSCQDTLQALRQACEKRFNEEGYPDETR